MAEVVSLSAGMPLIRTTPLALVKRTPPSKSSRFSNVRAPPMKGLVSGAHCPAESRQTVARKRTAMTTTAAIEPFLPSAGFPTLRD